MGRIKKERIKFGFFDVDLEDLNLEELKDYIRDGIDFINDYLEENNDLRKPQERFLKDIKDKTTRGRFGKELGYGLRMNKADLLSKAEDIDKFIRLSKDYDQERLNTAFEQFKRTTGDVSMETYKKLVNIFASLGHDLLEKFGSSNIVSLLQNNERIPSNKIVNAVKNALDNKNNKTKQDLVEDVEEALKFYLNK